MFCGMKTWVLSLLLMSAAVNATVVQPKAPKKLADGEFLGRQKSVLDLIVGIGHEHWYKSQYENFDIKSNIQQYTDQNVVNEFWREYDYGWMSKEQEFTLRDPKILRQTIKLFDLFYYAKNFDTFYKTACWAKKHVPGVQFAYVFYVAVYHRADCRGMVLPPLYEVFPASFLSKEVMWKIYEAKMEGIHSLKVYDNTTTWHNFWQKKSAGSLGHGGQTEAQFGGEERIDYLREDPGLNDYLAQLTIFYPRWLDQAKYSKVKYFRRGELFYYVFYQLLARYSLERWANHMPRPDVLQWDHPIMVGYNPRVVHPSGHYMYPRPAKLVPSEVNPGGVWRTQRSEWKILEDIQSGVIFYNGNGSYGRLPLEEVVNTWGNVVWDTKDSHDHNVYGSYFEWALDTIAHMVKTGSEHDYTSGPAGIYLTTGRDPAFYMFLQRLMDIFRHHKDALPAYTKNDLLFPGVKIESFQTGKLITYFERSDIEATYGVRIPASDTFKDYHYHGSQMRLNHKPFLYNIVINVDRAVEAVVRIFLGPKTTPRGYPLTAEEARAYFFEFDRFTVKLTKGENVIERDSKESTGVIREKEGLTSMYARVERSIKSNEPFYVSEAYNCGIPERLLLPKGSSNGRPLVFYTVVTPYDRKSSASAEERQFESPISCGGSRYYDGRPYGFPFDRRIDNEDVFDVPNIHREDVAVYHKKEIIRS